MVKRNLDLYRLYNGNDVFLKYLNHLNLISNSVFAYTDSSFYPMEHRFYFKDKNYNDTKGMGRRKIHIYRESFERSSNRILVRLLDRDMRPISCYVDEENFYGLLYDFKAFEGMLKYYCILLPKNIIEFNLGGRIC